MECLVTSSSFSSCCFIFHLYFIFILWIYINSMYKFSDSRSRSISFSLFLNKCMRFILFVRSFCHCCHDTVFYSGNEWVKNIEERKKCCWRRCFWHWMFIVAFDSILFILWFLLDVYKYHKPLLLLRGHHINERTHSVELGMCFKCEWLMKNFVLHTTFILSLVLTSVFSIRLKRTHNHGFNSRLTFQIISRPKGEQRNFVLSS